MSRKDSSFGQIVEYLEKGMSDGDGRFAHFHNMHPGDREQIVKDFLENAEYLRRKEGVQMFHEILSFTRSNELSNDEQKAILMDSVKEYLSERAPECMAYSVIHDEKEHHLHAHIVISSNPLESEKRHRLSKHDFAKVKRHAEKNVLENHPGMQQKLTIDKQGAKRESKGEAELKKRGGRTTQKDKTHETLKAIFSQARSEKELEDALKISGLAMSYRSGNRKSSPRFGKADSKKHFRLSTLGLESEYMKYSEGVLGKESDEPNQGVSRDSGIQDTKKSAESKKSTEKSENAKRDNLNEKRSGYNSYPWEDKKKEGQKDAQKQKQKSEDRKQRAKQDADEWLKGDFKERDKASIKKKYQAQNDYDRTVKSRKEQSTFEKVGEEVKEWVAGDFRARESRARTDKFNQAKTRANDVKSQAEQSKVENLKEKFSEYIKGDFTARDARALKEKLEARKTENMKASRDSSDSAEKTAQEEWFREDQTREFVDEKVAEYQESEKEKAILAQEAKERFQNSRAEAEKNNDKDKGKDRGR